MFIRNKSGYLYLDRAYRKGGKVFHWQKYLGKPEPPSKTKTLDTGIKSAHQLKIDKMFRQLYYYANKYEMSPNEYDWLHYVLKSYALGIVVPKGMRVRFLKNDFHDRIYSEWMVNFEIYQSIDRRDKTDRKFRAIRTGESIGLIYCHSLLGLPEQASWDDIRRKYRQLALVSHPDHGGNAEVFKKQTEAYNILKREREFQMRG